MLSYEWLMRPGCKAHAVRWHGGPAPMQSPEAQVIKPTLCGRGLVTFLVGRQAKDHDPHCADCLRVVLRKDIHTRN